MAELTVCGAGFTRRLPFEAPAPLDALLQEAGILLPHPCGGGGRCGKCAVTLTGAVSAPDEAERRADTRLACRAVLLGDATVTLPAADGAMQVESGGVSLSLAPDRVPFDGAYGAAVDIGTTTLAVRVYELASGACVGTATARNPQTAVAADVMGRIGAAINGAGDRLAQLVQTAIAALLQQAALGHRVTSAVLTGNTTMLYLLSRRDPACLARAPFTADTLFDTAVALAGVDGYLPPCIDAFVGADITCALYATGLCDRADTALLCDIGTNGEMALWHQGRLYVTSTAAGPAFEGAGISCGCGSVAGAIDRVSYRDGGLAIHTLDDAPAVGVCGSGLLDAVAAGLDAGVIDDTGAIDAPLTLADNVTLQAADIRAVQLAKAALAAGMQTLLTRAGVSEAQVTALYIAGGFGSHLSVDSAVRIGLLPAALADRVQVVGNAALAGAAALLLDRRAKHTLRTIAADATPVALGGDPHFNALYVEHMLFA